MPMWASCKGLHHGCVITGDIRFPTPVNHHAFWIVFGSRSVFGTIAVGP